MKQDPRLQKIKVSLTPQQVAASFIASALRHESLGDYVADFYSRDNSQSLLAELCEQVEESVINAMPEAGDAEFARVLRAGCQQGASLLFLHHAVVCQVEHEQRFLAVASLLVEERFWRLISCSCSDDSSTEASDANGLEERFRETAESLAVNVCSLRQAVSAIERKYFGQIAVVFKLSRLLLTQIEEDLEKYTNLYNSWWRAQGSIDLACLKAEAAARAERIELDLVDAARVDVFTHMGQSKAAREAARRIMLRSKMSTGGGREIPV